MLQLQFCNFNRVRCHLLQLTNECSGPDSRQQSRAPSSTMQPCNRSTTKRTAYAPTAFLPLLLAERLSHMLQHCPVGTTTAAGDRSGWCGRAASAVLAAFCVGASAAASAPAAPLPLLAALSAVPCRAVGAAAWAACALVAACMSAAGGCPPLELPRGRRSRLPAASARCWCCMSSCAVARSCAAYAALSCGMLLPSASSLPAMYLCRSTCKSSEALTTFCRISQ